MTDIPEPDSVAAEHSHRLRQLIRQRIESEGPQSFSRYMEQVLYEPGLGYYMAGAAKFGAAGDFITAPDVSPLYGAALGKEVQAILANHGGGILELGAGSGSLVLSMLQSWPQAKLPEYTILEPSADLAHRQRQLLSAHLGPAVRKRVRWVSALPDAFRGVIIANEVMDALPVERFIVGNPVEQVCITAGLTTMTRPAGQDLLDAVEAIELDIGEALSPGYCSEVCLYLKPWLASLAHVLQSGVVLLVDYGYPRREFYLPERNQGTLACYYRHRSHGDPFYWPGLQDITAHVDFTAVAEAAASHELDLLGYASQSAFLLDNDLLQLAQDLSVVQQREVQRLAISQAVKTLTLPGEMGERFQVMALGKGYEFPLRGFRTQDLSYRL